MTMKGLCCVTACPRAPPKVGLQQEWLLHSTTKYSSSGCEGMHLYIQCVLCVQVGSYTVCTASTGWQLYIVYCMYRLAFVQGVLCVQGVHVLCAQVYFCHNHTLCV